MIPIALSRLTAWAPAAPLLCALHCLATPLLVSLLPALHAGEAAEPWLFSAALPLVGAALWSELRAHGQRRVLVPVVTGASLWTASLAGWLAPAPEAVTIVGGSLLVAAGMSWSARLRHRATCPSCGCGGAG